MVDGGWLTGGQCLGTIKGERRLFVCCFVVQIPLLGLGWLGLPYYVPENPQEGEQSSCVVQDCDAVFQPILCMKTPVMMTNV
jgi:hypothetical protein